MPTPDDTLNAIDDVITDWHGSLDAMVWQADPPKQPDLSGLVMIVEAARPSPEAARAFAEGVAAQVRAITEAFRPMAEQMARTAQALVESPGWRQLVDFANSPEGRAYIEAAERGKPEPEPEPCHCWCQVSHKGQQGICQGDAVDEIVRVSPTVGRVQIPVCAVCRDAQMAEAAH